jgi:rhamnose utilization protein RhaD (predicted bifunctional aldolase and dehydrogenase)
MNDVLPQLIEMTRYLADPEKGFAILGEGNTSARVDDDTFYVKASGTSMVNIDANGFVRVSIAKITALLDDMNAGDDEVREAFQDAMIDPPEGKRPSVEAILHAILLQVPEFTFIGHTHPTYTNMILCSKNCEEAVNGRLFPDQIVSMKHKSVYVPYTDPGLPLAREVKKRLEAYIDENGGLPSVIMMQNHGLIVMGNSPRAVASATEMTEKSSRVIVGTYAMGGPNFLSPTNVSRIFTRPDEAYRLKSITGSQ